MNPYTEARRLLRDIPTASEAHWSNRAACIDEWRTFEAAFDHGEGRSHGGRQPYPNEHQSVTAAKAICRGCPVLQECREEVTVNPERYGVLGGWSPRERDLMRRARRTR